MAVIPRRIGADAGEFQTPRSASAKATCGGYLGAADVSVTCYPLFTRLCGSHGITEVPSH